MTAPQVVDLEALAADLHCTVDELRARIVRALQAAGVIPSNVRHVSDGDLLRRIVVSVQVDDRGQPTYWVQDTVTGEWRIL